MRALAVIFVFSVVTWAQKDSPALKFVARPALFKGKFTLPVWTGSSGGSLYQMVGSDPTTAAGNRTTTIEAPIIPLIITFQDGTVFDATVTDKTCGQTDSAAALTAASPIFNNHDYLLNGTSVGNTQYVDFFQRANYWQFTGPSGVTPDYHVLLTATTLPAIKISVPANRGTVSGTGCTKFGKIDIDWFDNYLDTVVIPGEDASVSPSSVPIFLASQTVLTNADGGCCIGGYHSARANSRFPGVTQTYIFADYSYSGDVSALSHEVGEWMDDPFTANATPRWGHTGQVAECQADLEVGDPLTGTLIRVQMPNGFNYHLQEMAFASWFYNQIPSSGIFGWYSSNGTFKTGAEVCLDLPLVSVNPTSLTFPAQSVGSISAPLSFTLSNSGTAPLTVNSVSIGGAAASDFSQTNNCVGAFDPRGACKVSVTFAPSAPGARSAVVTISDNAADSPQQVNLNGNQSGVQLTNQRVTSTAPPAGGTGCVRPTAGSAFTLPDKSVYLWFNATVLASDTLSNDWLAPDGGIVPGRTWSNVAGTFCFASASLDISSLPVNKLGTWSARIYYKGNVAALIPFAVNAEGLPTFTNQYILSQVADGGGWRTTLNLINPSTAPVTYQMNLIDHSGGALPIETGPGTASQFSGTIAPGASVTYTSSGNRGSQDGLANVASTQPLVASGVFSFSAAGGPTFEAAVPALAAKSQTLLLPFDNTNGKSTGLALANNGSSAATIAFVYRPESGSAAALGAQTLAASSKTAFVLTDKYPQLQNARGTLTMDAGSPALTALGIRGLPTGAFTSLPVYPVSPVDPVVSRQILSHVIDGGIWQSTITLINTDTQPATYELRIFDSAGNPAQTKLNGTAAAIFSGSISPLSSVTLVTQGASAPTPLDGWADVTSNQHLQAQLVFDQNTPGQPVFEAAVPAVGDGQSSVAMPFDNSDGLVTGVAVTNIGAA
ncbi:MAG: choice-of-anchor D domain-containing protein, partial [Terriglobia bacterium]